MNTIARSSFGHDILATLVAYATNGETEIISADAENVLKMLRPFGGRYKIVSEDETTARDVIKELKSGTLPDDLWNEIAGKTLPIVESNRKFPILEQAKRLGQKIVALVTEKTLTDGECGLSAAQQSLQIDVLKEIIDPQILYLFLQHYDKQNEYGNILHLQKWVEDLQAKLYIPGQQENPELLGIRKVPHVEYFNMFCLLDAIIGIAGTHTWIGLFCFPHIPQIILYNKNGIEHWDAIAKAFQKKGYKIYAIGYDEKTDMQKLAHEIAETYKKLW